MYEQFSDVKPAEGRVLGLVAAEGGAQQSGGDSLQADWGPHQHRHQQLHVCGGRQPSVLSQPESQSNILVPYTQ